MQTKPLGGERLGSGNKMNVHLHGFARANFNLTEIFRSTMSMGTLVPFLHKVALPGDTFDIELETAINTLPTIGPSFSSAKAQFDIFLCPWRLYNSYLHNNALKIGLNMSQVKLPVINFRQVINTTDPEPSDLDNSQVNPSCIWKYLGLSGGGYIKPTGAITSARAFNGISWLCYWDIYKNYYANKQEEVGAVIHTPTLTVNQTVTSINANGLVSQWPTTSNNWMTGQEGIIINYTGAAPDPATILILTDTAGWQPASNLFNAFIDNTGQITGQFMGTRWGSLTIQAWRYVTMSDLYNGTPGITMFPLSNIDDMRMQILAHQSTTVPFNIEASGLTPYTLPQDNTGAFFPRMGTQEGLALKTYQSDLFNNWLSTEWIDGIGGINDITAIDTSGGSFTIDTLNLSQKVYKLLNRIAVSDGTYNSWLDVVYDHKRTWASETPMYMGGLSKEIIFQEVVSNSASSDQPLGTIAGRGAYSGKHKGGRVRITVDEPAYILGIVSITPRIDYSQGNDWDLYLETMDDLHKPDLDQIGFQDLPTGRMAWWSEYWDGVKWVTPSAGKQPAWIEYMTSINKTYGNFAIKQNQGWMTFNRWYEAEDITDGKQIQDLTTYIDPSKFNYMFAETELDAQNYWMQISSKITARRKLSAKLMPNL